MGQRGWQRRLPWVRLLIVTSVFLVIVFFSGLIFFGSQSTSVDIALGAIAGVTALVPACAWLFSFTAKQSQEPPLQSVGKLVRNNFSMGDDQAANFHYITTPIQDAFEKARGALRDASTGAVAKRGILIIGESNVGKTRLAFEALVQTLPN